MLHYQYLHRRSFVRDGLWLLAINVVLFFYLLNMMY